MHHRPPIPIILNISAIPGIPPPPSPPNPPRLFPIDAITPVQNTMSAKTKQESVSQTYAASLPYRIGLRLGLASLPSSSLACLLRSASGVASVATYQVALTAESTVEKLHNTSRSQRTCIAWICAGVGIPFAPRPFPPAAACIF
jgi:hypothetical protein